MAIKSKQGTPINPLIGQRVMLARRAQHMTQHELAAQAGTSPTVINRLETGQQSVSAERLAEIARVLHVSLDFLCSKEEAPLAQPKAKRPRPATAGA
jgi:transcriptional regulator with XRE-family HTH domain